MPSPLLSRRSATTGLVLVFIIWSSRLGLAQAARPDVEFLETRIAASIESRDEKALLKLFADSVRLVRSNALFISPVTAVAFLERLYPIGPDHGYQRNVLDVSVSTSGEIAVVHGVHHWTPSADTRAASWPTNHGEYVAVWTRDDPMRSQWRLHSEAPFESWNPELLDLSLFTRQDFTVVLPKVVPGVLELEGPGTFWPSKAGDVAYGVGDYWYFPGGAGSEEVLVGYYLTVWTRPIPTEPWRLKYSCFPKPEAWPYGPPNQAGAADGTRRFAPGSAADPQGR